MVTINKFGDDTKLGGVTDAPEGCPTIQRCLDRLKQRAQVNLMRFKKVKCKALSNLMQLRMFLFIAGELDKMTFKGPFQF